MVDGCQNWQKCDFSLNIGATRIAGLPSRKRRLIIFTMITKPQQIPPATDLRHIVKYYWSIEWTGTAEKNTVLKIVTDAYPELLFHAGEVPKRMFFGAESSFQTSSCVTGIFLRHALIDLKGAVRMLFVKLQPWAITPILGVKGSNLIDLQQDLSEFSKYTGPPVREMMEEGKEMQEIVHCLETWIRMRVKGWEADMALKGAVNMIQVRKGNLSIRALEGKFMIGRRRLEQLFKEGIGVSPKAYARMVRIRHTCQAMLDNPHCPLSFLAASSGFSDQAHLTREFQYFLNTTPKCYKLALRDKGSLYQVSL